MASTSRESLEHTEVSGSAQVKITILASEWGSSKGGLSTINRELAIQLAKSSSVEITFFVPQCSDEDKEEALRHNVHILKATPLTGYEELEWLSFPPKDLEIHIIVGHGVKLGRQAQVIRNSHECKWVQVVHTDPEELGMFKSYTNPISAGEKKRGDEVELCNLADFVVGIGPKLTEAFRSYLGWCRKEETIFDYTPGLFDEFMSIKQVPEERKHPTVLVFGRGDAEDFELKGFDIAARAVASLPDTHLLFFGAPDGKLEEVAQRFLDCDVPANRLKVRSYDKSREGLKRLFCEVDLVLMPSRTEGFGLAGLEALSAGLPVLVCQNSGFGEALSKVPFGSSFVINSEDSERWAAAIKKAWGKGRQSLLEEAEILRSSYERKYSWSEQSDALLFKMINLVRARLRLKIDCEVINGRGAPATTMGMGMKPHEPHSLVQDDAALLSIASNQPEEVHSSSKVGNGSIPSGDELFRMSADRYLRTINPSKPEEFNRYLQYLKELRKLLIVDVQVRCLIITVEIRSLQILEDLWEDYRTGHLNKMAQKFLLPEDVLKEFGVSEVRMTTTIAEEEYRACRDFFERPGRWRGLGEDEDDKSFRTFELDPLSSLSGLGSKDVSLAEVVRTNPVLIDQLALLLDREKRLIANWKHLCRVLKVDPKVVSSLEHYTDFSPTIRLFEHLEVVKPDLSIQHLKQALSDIGRNDLVSLLTCKACCLNSELVKDVITSTNVVAPRDGLLDDLALALDVQSKCLANWRKLAQKLGVEQQVLKQLERRSTESPANKLFEYLRATSPQMKLKTLKEALGMMKRNDVLRILQERNLDEETLLKDIITPESEILQVLEEKLNFDDVPWAKNWRQLACNLKIPREVYEEFDGTSRQRKSPTREMMKCLVGQDPGINLTDIVEALEKIKRNDAIQIITEHVPDTVDSVLERRGCSFDNNLMFDSQVNAPAHDASSLQICKVEGSTSSSFTKQADFRKPGHCGSLPDVRYDLVGRDDVCNQIVTSLMSNKAVEIIAPPGYGKTSLVIETAHRLIAKGNFVAYVNPRGVTCVEDLGSEIIEALGEVPGENTIQKTLRRIRSLKAKNVVLIIENLDSLLHLEKNQPLKSPGRRGGEYCATMQGNYKRDDFLTFIKEIGKTRAIHLVLTSTETNDFSVFFPTELIELQPLSEEDSFVLFQERDSSLDETTIKGLITISGGIPLVICIVLSLLKNSNLRNFPRKMSTSKAFEFIKELSPDFLPNEDRIGQCLQLCIRHLDEDNQDVLVKLSAFPNRFTQEQFLAVFQSMKPDDNLEDRLNSINYCGLLRFERDSCHYCIHPFIRTFCSTQHKHKEAKSHFIRHYSELVVSLSERFLSRDSRTAVEEYRKEKENIREATAWCEDEHPDLDRELQEYCIDSCNKACVFLAKVMRKQEFEALFCKFSHQCRYDLDRHSACLTAIGMKIVLSCTCTPQICVRAWCRAKSFLSRANEIQLSRNTVDDVTRAQCLSKLGFCLVREGRSDEGFEYLDQAMKLRAKLYEGSSEDKDKVMLAACQNDLAASLMVQQKHLASIETRRSVVLPIYEAILGNHPFVATTLTGIAKSYHELGDYDKAILLSAQALEIREPLLGRHQETAKSYYDLGVALAAKEEYERSLKHLEQAAEIQEEVLDTHEELILTHQAIAVVLKELGRDDESEREMERAKDCAQKLYSLEIAVQTFRIHEEEGSWQKTDPVRIGSP